VQELFSLTFEFHKHDAIAELGMAGDDESSDDNGVAVEPDGGMKADADGERNQQLDVTAAAADVGGFEAHRDVAAFLVDFDLDLKGVARVKAAVMFGNSGGRGLGVGRIHGSAPGLCTYRVLD